MSHIIWCWVEANVHHRNQQCLVVWWSALLRIRHGGSQGFFCFFASGPLGSVGPNRAKRSPWPQIGPNGAKLVRMGPKGLNGPQGPEWAPGPERAPGARMGQGPHGLCTDTYGIIHLGCDETASHTLPYITMGFHIEIDVQAPFGKDFI